MPSRFEEILAKKRQEQQVPDIPISPVYPIRDFLESLMKNDARYREIERASQDKDLIDAFDAIRKHFLKHLPQIRTPIQTPMGSYLRPGPGIVLPKHAIAPAERTFSEIRTIVNAEKYLKIVEPVVTVDHWNYAHSTPWSILRISLEVGSMSSQFVFGARVTILWDLEQEAIGYLYSDQSHHPNESYFLSLDDLLEKIALTLLVEPAPYAISMNERNRKNQFWAKFRENNRPAIELFNIMAAANATPDLPYFYPEDEMDARRYKAIIELINAEFARVDLLKQIASNTGNTERHAGETARNTGEVVKVLTQTAVNTSALMGLSQAGNQQLTQQGLQLDAINKQIADLALSLKTDNS